MKEKRWLLAIVVLGALGILTFCCVSGLLVVNQIPLPKVETTEPTPARPSLSPHGGTLRLWGELPPTLDPAMVQDATSAEYVVHLFSGLVTLNAALEIQPDLAVDWEVLDNGRRYIFHLAPDAAFADGTPITAEDVIYSLERACSPELESPVALAYLGDIVGAEAFAQGQSDHIAGLEALDAHTLQVTIDAPKRYFLAKLTYPVAFVVDRRQIEREGSQWFLRPNGSGPFVLVELSTERLVLQRNERYHGQKPALKRVIYQFSGGMPITMYENDELDIITVPMSDLDRVLDPYNPLSTQVHVVSELSTQYIGFNVAQPPFDDPAVRKAVLLAIDREKIADLVLNQGAKPARGILPPALAPDDHPQEVMAYDPQKARALLASSRYAKQGNWPPIILTVSGTSGHLAPVPRAVIAMLQENLGWDVLVEQVAWRDFLEDLNAKRYGMFLSGWIADYPDPQNFLDLLFHSASAQNHLNYANPAVDALLEQARVEEDPSLRQRQYDEAERLILEDAAWVPLTHGVTYTLVKPWVQGYQPSASLYPWLKEISLVE